jgi:hypothetical protein
MENVGAKIRLFFSRDEEEKKIGKIKTKRLLFEKKCFGIEMT